MPTLQDYWKIPFRGFVPGGLNDQKDNPALPKITNPDDAPIMEDAVVDHDAVINEADPEVEVKALPVVIVDDESHIIGNIRRYFHAFQVQVGAVETVQVLGVDPSRTRILIRNVGPGSVFIGDTESVRDSGYSLFQITSQAPLELVTTEEVWMFQEASQSSNAVVHILVEFDKKGYTSK